MIISASETKLMIFFLYAFFPINFFLSGKKENYPQPHPQKIQKNKPNSIKY